MKEYKTLTREKVNVDPTVVRYFSGETHLMQDWSDKMLDLILNGPTLNGFRKDEVRSMLRETYAALKGYETIGPMASPFLNDPPAIVARAFRELYPAPSTSRSSSPTCGTKAAPPSTARHYSRATAARRSSAYRQRHPSARPLSCWPTSSPTSSPARTPDTAPSGRLPRRLFSKGTTRSSRR